MSKDAKYSIRLLAEKSGVSMHTIRAWEKRHNALRPQRSRGNRRLYTPLDLVRLQLLRQATTAGHTIGTVAGLSTRQLWLLFNAEPAPSLSAGTALQSATADSFLEACWLAVQQLDDRALQHALQHAAVMLSQPVFLENVLAPLLERVGQSWRQGQLRIIHEHLATVVLREFLAHLRLAYVPEPTAPAIVVATPSGQVHELGASMVALTAAAQGWHVYFLGANLPADELAAAVHLYGALVLALSVIHPSDDPQLALDMEMVRRLVHKETVIMVGGAAAMSNRDLFQRLGMSVIQSVSEFRRRLQELRVGHPAAAST